MTLIDRLEASEQGSRELDAEIAEAFGRKHGPDHGWCNGENGDYWTVDDCASPYSTSLDAAMTLVPEGWMLSGLAETIDGKATAQIEKRFTEFQRKTFENGGQVVVESEFGQAATPAMALCIAALKASSHQEEK